MIISREVIIAIMVQLRLEFQGCKCERCSIDYHERFTELVQQYIDYERKKNETI